MIRNKLSNKLNTPFRSSVKGKKYSVLVKKNGKIIKVNFGLLGSADWLGTDGNQATKEQRKSFRARSMGIKKKDGTFAYKDITSPVYWNPKYSW